LVFSAAPLGGRLGKEEPLFPPVLLGFLCLIPSGTEGFFSNITKQSLPDTGSNGMWSEAAFGFPSDPRRTSQWPSPLLTVLSLRQHRCRQRHWASNLIHGHIVKTTVSPSDNFLTCESKGLSEAIQTLDGQKLERVIQIIHEGVPKIRGVPSLLRKSPSKFLMHAPPVCI